MLYDAQEGDIVVLKRGKNKYHVGTFVEYSNSHILIRGGNQNNRVKESWYPIDRLVSIANYETCLLYTSPSPRDGLLSRMPSSA